MQKVLQAYKSKHTDTFCPHRIMVRHPQYVAYFSHRRKIKVLRTEKRTKCLLRIPLSHSHEDPDVIGTDCPSSSLQDQNLVWECSDLFFKGSPNKIFLEITQ